MNTRSYYVYMLTNATNRVLYIGVTSDLERRIFQHREGGIEGFTKRYRCHKLVYYEETNDVTVAIAREKELKGWKRTKKDDLIETINPSWRDLLPR